MQIIIIIVAVLLLFFAAGYRIEQNEKKAYRQSLKDGYGKANKRKYGADELLSIKGYNSFHKSEDMIDDTTWNDLDMNLIYAAMNYCRSSAGDEYLYYMLRNPLIRDIDISDTEKKISSLSEDENTRLDLQMCLHEMGRTGSYSIYSYLNRLDEVKSTPKLKSMIGPLLYIPAIVLCFFSLAWGLGCIFVLALYNIASYFKHKNKIEPYIVCFEYVFRILDNCDRICETVKQKKDHVLKDETFRLSEISKNFKNFKRFSSLVVGKLGTGPVGIVMDYVKMLTHMDLIKFDSMLIQVKEHKNEVDEILGIIGRIDCYIAIGEYRAFLKKWCTPDLSSDNKGLYIANGYHPLIKDAVPNSIDAKKCVLLTGSNASGKSTFLKMVAVNALLAQSVNTVCAEEYRAPYYSIYSSLSLKDSIVSGESYYMAEIRSLKRIMDAVDRNKHVLGFVDEVLRGTNTIERIAASSAILRNLNLKGVLVFAATHDLELTKILEEEYDNYHFTEVIDAEDVRFPYKLAEGKAVSRNAIRLLISMGYDSDIIDGAIEMVKKMENRS